MVREVTAADVLAAFCRREAPGEAVVRQAEAVSRACLDMARRFETGGALYVFGGGAASTDSEHVAVEFIHPVVVGKRALPAISLANDVAAIAGLDEHFGHEAIFERQLAVVGRPGDIALGIGESRSVLTALATAKKRSLLTVMLAAGRLPEEPPPISTDHVLTASTDDPLVAKEVHVTIYHVLWELVHLLLEQVSPIGMSTVGEPAEDAVCITCSDEAVTATVTEMLDDGFAVVDTGTTKERVSIALVDAARGDTVLVHAGEAIGLAPSPHPAKGGGRLAELSSLYPFLYEPHRDFDELLLQLAGSTAEKAAEIVRLRTSLAETVAEEMASCAAAVAERSMSGARIFAFGNGGSSTDAAEVARLFLSPARGQAIPAFSLTNDVATTTALANDIGVESIFARPLATLARPGDVAIALSTSGGSANVIAGLQAAARIGMLTIGFAGYEGGRMSELRESGLDYLFVIPSSSVHRIQEAQTTAYHVLWELVQLALGS